MADEAKRVQVNMSKELRDLLRDWAAEMSKAKDEDFGTGTVAALLFESLPVHGRDMQKPVLKEPLRAFVTM